jgi:hypothetical protein
MRNWIILVAVAAAIGMTVVQGIWVSTLAQLERPDFPGTGLQN